MTDQLKDLAAVDGIVSGELVFKLMDSQGLPLEMIIDTCFNQRVLINWAEFIETGWKHNWYSYQIYDKVMFAFAESLNYANNHAYRTEIKSRLQLYILLKDETLKEVALSPT